jgi:uncharacterized cupin superfamily protein
VTKTTRPEFIANFRELLEPAPEWARDTDLDAQTARLGKKLGLTRLGVNLEVIPPGCRSSLPHAHEREEEFVFVLSGHPEAWIDGVLHQLRSGDGVAFPPGTGIAHSFLNNTDEPVHLLVVGDMHGDRVFYPLDPQMQNHPRFWHEAPRHELGPHDGRPTRRP